MVYEPQPVTTSWPPIAGTEKVCVPELVLAGELVCGELFGRAECRCLGEAVGDDLGVLVSADVGVPARAAADPLVAGGDVAAEGFGPLVPQAVRPAPPMTAAMITAEIRHILMLLPSDERPIINRK